MPTPSDSSSIVLIAIRELTGVQLRIVRTNSKELRLQPWQFSFGAELAACLHLFSAEFSHALIGSSEPYDALVLPWGSNPVTDHLLSGGHLTIVHDGAAFSRTDKIAFLSRFPAALKSLKVCWQGRQQGRNCGIMREMRQDALNLLAAGIATRRASTVHSISGAIAGHPIANDTVLGELRSIVQYAERRIWTRNGSAPLRKRLRRGKSNWTLRASCAEVARQGWPPRNRTTAAPLGTGDVHGDAVAPAQAHEDRIEPAQAAPGCP